MGSGDKLRGIFGSIHSLRNTTIFSSSVCDPILNTTMWKEPTVTAGNSYVVDKIIEITNWNYGFKTELICLKR